MDISCIIATRHRAESLRVTLECLAGTDRAGLECEVVVVDNGGEDATAEVARSFGGRLAVRYLTEPYRGRDGKGSCLNRALDAGGLGAIIAVLDDDMSPEPGWFQAVAAACRRWPDMDIFTGRSHVVWPCPESDVPPWAKGRRIRSWAYSVIDAGEEDREASPGRWFSGNHFWFRARAIAGGRRFPDRWNAEGIFQLDLQGDGHRGVTIPEAVTGHRLQPSLLDFDTILDRAGMVGRAFASIRLEPFRPNVRVATSFRDSPLLVRIYSHLARMAWTARGWAARLLGGLADGRWREERLVARERATYFGELLRLAARHPEYALRRPWRLGGSWK